MKQRIIPFLAALLMILLLQGCQKQQVNPEATATSTKQAIKLPASRVALSQTQVFIRKWTEWVLARDYSEAPWDDATGAKQYAGQPYATGTMMLAGGSSPDLVTRDITISLSQYQQVFFPLVNFLSYWNDCYPGHPDNGNVPPGAVSSFITEALNGKRTIVLNWDGQSLITDKLKDFRSNSEYWQFSIHPSWDNGCIATATTLYVDGFWAKVPLSLGTHTLEIAGDADIRRIKTPFSNHVIYHITVTN